MITIFSFVNYHYLLCLSRSCAVALSEQRASRMIHAARTRYNRAQGQLGRAVMSPMLAYGAAGETSLVVSQAIRHGYIADDDSDFGMANTAAIVGGELDYHQLHDLLYGEGKLKGTNNLSTSICGSNEDPSALLCFVIDQVFPKSHST